MHGGTFCGANKEMSKRVPVIRRVDANQVQIVKELREAGYSVIDIHVIGGGVPDLIVAQQGGRTILVEIKASWRKNLTDDERDFFMAWRGDKIVATSAKEIIDWFS